MTAKMETPFYHDDSHAIHSFSQFPEYERYAGNKMLMCKKAMSMSVASHHFTGGGGGGGVAGARGANPNNLGLANLATPSASSADMNMLKLGSPDLEHLIIQSNQGLVAGGPLSHSANPFLYRNQATNEQEGFADGFVKALADLHKQNQLVGGHMSPSSSSNVSLQASYQRNLMSTGDVPIYTNLGSYNQGQLAYSAAPMTYGGSSGHNVVGGGAPPPPHARGPDAPQTVPEVPHLPGDPTSPPSLSPIDLASTASMLREQVSQLKQKVMSHVTNGCQIAVGSPGSKSGGRGCGGGGASEDSSC